MSLATALAIGRRHRDEEPAHDDGDHGEQRDEHLRSSTGAASAPDRTAACAKARLAASAASPAPAGSVPCCTCCIELTSTHSVDATSQVQGHRAAPDARNHITRRVRPRLVGLVALLERFFTRGGTGPPQPSCSPECRQQRRSSRSTAGRHPLPTGATEEPRRRSPRTCRRGSHSGARAPPRTG